jgi:hypothetical protein
MKILLSSFSNRKKMKDFPAFFIIDEHIPQTELPRLYKAVDCFVLPSRGEGIVFAINCCETIFIFD